MCSLRDTPKQTGPSLPPSIPTNTEQAENHFHRTLARGRGHRNSPSLNPGCHAVNTAGLAVASVTAALWALLLPLPDWLLSPLRGCYSQEDPQGNHVHVNLHLRDCFPGNPTPNNPNPTLIILQTRSEHQTTSVNCLPAPPAPRLCSPFLTQLSSCGPSARLSSVGLAWGNPNAVTALK